MSTTQTNSMNEKHHTAIAEDRSKLDKFEALLRAINVPDIFSYYLRDGSFNLYLQYKSNKDELLLEVGKAFGTTGWSAKGAHDHYDWTKEVMGVKVCILYANKLPSLPDYEVTSKEWPIQLEDVRPNDGKRL